MNAKGLVAMILAGGRGERLGGLSHYYSKPAIHFGGDRRIIDFTLNNCRNSGIGTIGILSQYFTTDLNEYVSVAHSEGMENGVIHLLPSKNPASAYTGTADAVCRNIKFIDRFMPDDVLILSGDHIYKMDYTDMIAFHKERGADVTVASSPVKKKDASRFGILNAAAGGHVLSFVEKPSKPRSNLASMGIYVFKWSVLKKYLLADCENKQSHHDFGKNIIPDMLSSDERVFTYRYNGYWRDVGTVDSLWEANMDQVDDPSVYGPEDNEWNPPGSRIGDAPIMMSGEAIIRNSIVYGGCSIFGKLEHSVLSDSITVSKGAEIVNSFVMPGAYIGNNVKIYNAIVGTNAQIMDNTVIGAEYGMDFFVDRKMCSRGVSLVAPWLYIEEGMSFQIGSHIYKERLNQYEDSRNKMDRLKYVNGFIGIHSPMHSKFDV